MPVLCKVRHAKCITEVLNSLVLDTFLLFYYVNENALMHQDVTGSYMNSSMELKIYAAHETGIIQREIFKCRVYCRVEMI